LTHVQQIVAALREVLGQLEEVEELLDIAEVHRAEDAEELAKLRRTLDQLQRARDVVRLPPERHRLRPPPCVAPPAAEAQET
jgi:hypothetical protein